MRRSFVPLLACLAVLAAAIATQPAPVLAAGSGQSGPARSADVRLSIAASHGQGAAAQQSHLPVRKGPQMKTVAAQSVKAPAAGGSLEAPVSQTADQPGIGTNGGTPSDSTGSIGPLHYIEMVNSRVAMYNRSLGLVAGPLNLGTFVGALGGGQVGDVQVQWDQQGGRWIYAMLEVYSNDVKIAVGWSKGGDVGGLTLANSDWCNFHIDTGTDFYDYPKLGHDANYILIGANVFAGGPTYIGSSIVVVPKPVAGDTSCTTPSSVVAFGSVRHPSPDSSLAFTPVPTNVTDNSSTAYVVAIDPAVVGVWHVSPSPVGACSTPPCLVTDGDIAITLWVPTPSPNIDFMVPQPGGNPNIDALEGRLTQSVQRSDPGAGGAEGVWTQHTTGSSSGRTVSTWFELIPSACTAGVCPLTAKRQEGTVASPSLYIFNSSISPTSNGDAAIIQYNTGSDQTFDDVRAQSHDAADPLGTMSGELVLRSSTVADTDFSCYSPFGPPCRWGDYSGMSPDPTNCTTVWGTNMLSGDVAANGAGPTWVTQNFAVAESRIRSAVSTQQYVLSGSDGQTWKDVDAANLQVRAAPCADSTGLISANADLFTSLAGVNQDIGLFVDVDGTAGTSPIAWKESGGFNGAFSPNAAYVQATFPMPAGHTYTVHLRWKANVSTSGSIFSGAGPISNAYSPTRLTLHLFSSAPAQSSLVTQPQLTGSDGVTWQPVTGVTPLSLSPASDARVVLGGNADLWTDTAGINQDLGIMVNGSLAAWKESGGNNGTQSPNAAFVQAVANLTGGQSYTVQLVWKTNHAAPATSSIYAGAGPLSGTGSFSPTTLTAYMLPAGANPYRGVITTQGSLTSSDGATWSSLGVQVAVTPAGPTYALIDANADLWTAKAGLNQDLAIFVSDNGGAPKLLAWKESGGFGGTYSPNAAFGQTEFLMSGGHTYTFSLRWKTNHAATGPGATIFAGAGPISGSFSPTSLDVELVA